MAYFLKRLGTSLVIFAGMLLFLFGLLFLILASGKGFFVEVDWHFTVGASIFLLALVMWSVVLSRYGVKRTPASSLSARPSAPSDLPPK